MVRMLWRPWLTYIHGSNANCAHFSSLFVIMITAFQTNRLQLNQNCLLTQTSLMSFPFGKLGSRTYFKNIHIWNAWPSWKGIKKEFWTTLGLCKISSFSAISAQVVAKSFKNRWQKFVDTHFSHKLSSKNVKTLGENTWNTFGKIYHICPRCVQSLIVWWCSVGADIRCHKGTQAITLRYW